MIRDTMLQIIPTRALKRVNPDWLTKGEAELNERLRDRRGHRDAERAMHGGRS